MIFLRLMGTKYMSKIEQKYVKRTPDIRTGDTVKVHLRITEGGKERIQVFEGIVIAIKGSGLSKTFTVRKISHGIGVEKILPVNSPVIKKIDIVERGKKVRRSKLYYVRGKVGKRSLDMKVDENFEVQEEMEDVPVEEDKKESKVTESEVVESEVADKAEDSAKDVKDVKKEEKVSPAKKEKHPKEEKK